jgi:DNA-binding response OmpR family regulator
MNQAEELREQLRAYQDEDRQRKDDENYRALRDAFGLSVQQAWICMALYQRGQTVMTTWLLDNRNAIIAEDTDPRTIIVQVCKMRKKLPKGSIVNVWGKGYRMTEIGRAAVRGILP